MLDIRPSHQRQRRQFGGHTHQQATPCTRPGVFQCKNPLGLRERRFHNRALVVQFALHLRRQLRFLVLPMRGDQPNVLLGFQPRLAARIQQPLIAPNRPLLLVGQQLFQSVAFIATGR